jgi:hypothetical protein
LIWISVEELNLILRLQRSLCLKIISFLLILPIRRILHLLFKLIGYKFFNLSIRKLIIIYKDLLILLYHFFKFRNKLELWMLCKLIYHCFKGILIRIIFRKCRKICLLFCRKIRKIKNLKLKYLLEYSMDILWINFNLLDLKRVRKQKCIKTFHLKICHFKMS